jgi:hypothetical protein
LLSASCSGRRVLLFKRHGSHSANLGQRLGMAP